MQHASTQGWPASGISAHLAGNKEATGAFMQIHGYLRHALAGAGLSVLAVSARAIFLPS